MALGSNNFQGSITFNVDQAISQIDALQQKIDRWTSALNNPNYSPAVINSLEKEIERANISLAQLQQTTIDTGNALQNNLNVPATSSFRAMTSLDRVTREFANGSMQSGMNGLVGFGNAMSRMVMQAGSVEGAFQGIGSAIMGPMGIVLLISAAIGAFEAFSKSEKEAEKNTVDFGKTIIDTNQEIKDALNLHNAQITSMKSLVAVASDYTVAENTRAEALKRIKSELSSVNKEEANKLKTTQDIISASYQYIEALKSQQLAEVSGKRIAELDLQIAEDRNKVASSTGKGIHLMEILGISDSDVQVAQARIGKAEGLKRILEDINKSAIIQSLNNPFSADNSSGGTDKKAKEDKTNLELLKAKQAFYKDDIYQFENYADQIANEEERLAIIKAKQNKESTKEIENIHSLYEQKRLNNMKVLGDEIAKEQEKQAKEEEKREKEEVQVLEDIQIEAAKDNISRIEDDLKVQEKIANKDFEQKKIAIKKAMADITASMGGVENTKAVDMYTKSLSNLDKQLKIVEADEKNNDIKKQEEYYKKFAKTLATDVTNGLMTMWDAMQKGENPLKAIGDMLMKMVEQLAQAVIQAVLLQTIMSAFGMGSVEKGGFGSIGGAIKSVFGFADGGVVSQPTLMMAGEGGQSEAIMPLNKLGNMMNNTFSAGASSGLGQGSGGGQFTLKGNDLVLALQRSNYSLNLRRGS